MQIANQYGVNPGYLMQLVDYLQRSNGATASVLYAWEILGTGARLSDWASPVAKLFTDQPAGAPEALAARYEALFPAGS